MKHSLFWRLFLPVIGIFIVCLALVSWYIPTAIRSNAEQEAVAIAEQTVNQFKTLRKYYTQNVVSKIIGRDGLKGSVNHKNEKDSFPLPATMIHDLADLLKDQGTNLKLYSKYPFPNRKSRQLDDFAQNAWKELNADPKGIYSITEETDAGTFTRVGIADLMVSEVCVACHNAHPDTPKADWKLGDVRGVLEVQMNIDTQLKNGSAISSTLISILVALTIVMGLVMVLIYRKVIAVRLHSVANALNEIAQGDGDLTKRLDASGKDEVATIALNFNQFADKLETTIKEIVQSTDQLATTSTELLDVAKTTSHAILKQDSQTDQVATAITQMSATAEEIANNATGAAKGSKETQDAAAKGQQIVTQSLQATDLLASDVGQAAEALGHLEEDSTRITGVLDVIKGIAEQTNLLALNAAIEAARAGEQGRGFAVVADEVRTLAARTQESTTEIQEMTDRLLQTTQQAVTVMQKSQQNAGESVKLSNEVQDSLTHITESIDNINDMNAHISAAVNEQSTVANALHDNISDIVSQSSATAHGAEQTIEHVGSLESVVKKISSLTGHFKVSK